MKDPIKKLNDKLGQLFGRKFDRPLYAWRLTSDIKIPMQDSTQWVQAPQGSLYVQRTEYRMVEYYDCDPPRWLLARLWVPPSIEEWQSSFQGQIGYPSHGLYFPTDQMLKPGVAPTEELTDYMASLIRSQLEMEQRGEQGAVEAFVRLTEARERLERQAEEEIRGQLDEILPTPDGTCRVFMS